MSSLVIQAFAFMPFHEDCMHQDSSQDSRILTLKEVPVSTELAQQWRCAMMQALI